MPTNDDKAVSSEQIVAEVRRNIEYWYTNDDVAALEPPSYFGAHAQVNPAVSCDRRLLKEQLAITASASHIEWHRTLEGNRLYVFVKRVVRKLNTFLVAPIVDDQRRFNDAAAKSLQQMSLRLEEQERMIVKLQSEMAKFKAN